MNVVSGNHCYSKSSLHLSDLNTKRRKRQWRRKWWYIVNTCKHVQAHLQLHPVLIGNSPENRSIEHDFAYSRQIIMGRFAVAGMNFRPNFPIKASARNYRSDIKSCEWPALIRRSDEFITVRFTSISCLVLIRQLACSDEQLRVIVPFSSIVRKRDHIFLLLFRWPREKAYPTPSDSQLHCLRQRN
jgi:hypothetical protein